MITVHGHVRLECPPPRSGNTGVKDGPCDAPDDPSLPAFALNAGQFNTITWLESISHPAAPARFALSLEGVDEGFESCLLLDHVPHDDLSLVPSFGNELTYHRQSITLYIPDVYCERCFLQIVSTMSDEFHGVKAGTTCAYPDAQKAGLADSTLPPCTQVYHSCAPVSINGSVPRNDIATCDTADFEDKLGWPLKDRAYSTYYHKGDSGLYNQTFSQLLAFGAPIENCVNFEFCDPNKFFKTALEVPDGAMYTALEGPCAPVVETKVAAFELGKLPTEQKDLSAEGKPRRGSLLGFLSTIVGTVLACTA